MDKTDLIQANEIYKRYIQRWQFLINSYQGGLEYKEGNYLLGYIMESRDEYDTRMHNTPLDNHVKSCTSVYNSFLFRKPPQRDFGSLALDPSLDSFLKDADLDGRSFDSVMRDVSTYATVYGHTWCVIDKPSSTAFTRAEELGQGIRPYISIYTPENVFDWEYRRAPNGFYVLVYLKLYEGNVNGVDTFRIYTPETVTVMTVDQNDNKSVVIESEMVNELGIIPAVCVYGQRSPTKGVGISDVGDIADMQRTIFNELSELEQVVRLTNHPSLVKHASTAASAGAGSIIQIPEDVGNNYIQPYLLQPTGASIDSLILSLNHKIQSIDRMAHMGGIRSIESRRLSGVALATEFQLLNAKLSDKASNLEHAEEQLWRIYAQWQDQAWDGQIDYPDSFNIQDKYNDMNMLKLAKEAGPKSLVVQEEIEKQMLRILIDDDQIYTNLVNEVEIEDVNEYEESLDKMNLIEKAKEVLQSTSGNDTVDMIFGSKIIDEIIEDPILREQISNSYAGRPVSDLAIEQATQEEQRTYPDGEEIDSDLPDAYQPASNASVPQGQNCDNCGYYDPQTMLCSKWNNAEVRPTYWCAVWEPVDELGTE